MALLSSGSFDDASMLAVLLGRDGDSPLDRAIATDVWRGLRRTTRGDYSCEAATELLIRSGLARPRHPWIRWEDNSDRAWVDLGTLVEYSDGMPSQQATVVDIAIALFDRTRPVSLRHLLEGLDAENRDAVLGALAHSAGERTVWLSPVIPSPTP